jgi:hypothetical protein
MNSRFLQVLGILGMASFAASAQTMERRAVFTGGGNPSEGKCTIEVVVDVAADVEIRGDRAVLRTLGGRPAEWRRFQCSSPMPPNMADFHFAGVDGRGSQRLQQDPRSRGGVAIVHIEDPAGGSEGYTFDLTWRGGAPPPPPPPISDRDRDRDRDRNRPRFSVDDAVRLCQDAVRDRASDRLRGARIDFRRSGPDDDPNRRDMIVGTFEASRDNRRPDLFRFSCAVDFGAGRVRSVDFDPADRR